MRSHAGYATDVSRDPCEPGSGCRVSCRVSHVEGTAISRFRRSKNSHCSLENRAAPGYKAIIRVTDCFFSGSSPLPIPWHPLPGYSVSQFRSHKTPWRFAEVDSFLPAIEPNLNTNPDSSCHPQPGACQEHGNRIPNECSHSGIVGHSSGVQTIKSFPSLMNISSKCSAVRRWRVVFTP